MKIKFDADDDLPLNKPLKLWTMKTTLDLFLKKKVNFICTFVQMGVCMNYKNVAVRKYCFRKN